MWQLVESIEGMAAACEELNVPVVGGNVSLYNQTDGVDIYPAPVVGMLGFCDPMPEQPPRLDRAESGMSIWLIGPPPQNDFAASAYDRIINDNLGGRPVEADPDIARKVINAAVSLAFDTPVLHDISVGGIAVALAEIAFKSDIGFILDSLSGAELFDETPLRFLAIAPAGELDTDAPYRRIGTMGGSELVFSAAGSIGLKDAEAIWYAALPRRMEH
jgi:phosphoribosylformylglycinamidine synthase